MYGSRTVVYSLHIHCPDATMQLCNLLSSLFNTTNFSLISIRFGMALITNTAGRSEYCEHLQSDLGSDLSRRCDIDTAHRVRNAVAVGMYTALGYLCRTCSLGRR